MYRAIKSMKLPPMSRAMPGRIDNGVYGAVFGLTMGRNKMPYVAHAPSKVVELVKTIRNQMLELDPEFRFT